jgi:hypothetical protein
VHVHAADRDDSSRNFVRGLHQLPRLLSRTQDHIDDDVRRKSAQLTFVIGKPIPVSLDLYNPRVGKTSIGATVKKRDLMSGAEQFLHQGRADETIPADHKDSHTRLDEQFRAKLQ